MIKCSACMTDNSEGSLSCNVCGQLLDRHLTLTSRSIPLEPSTGDPSTHTAHLGNLPERGIAVYVGSAQEPIITSTRERVTLAPLESLEAVDGDLLDCSDSPELPGLNEKAVAAETGNLVRDGGGTAAQGASDLSVRHAPDDHHEQTSDQLRTLLPVRGREGLDTEVTLARKTRKPLDTMRTGLARVEAFLLERPVTR